MKTSLTLNLCRSTASLLTLHHAGAHQGEEEAGRLAAQGGHPRASKVKAAKAAQAHPATCLQRLRKRRLVLARLAS